VGEGNIVYHYKAKGKKKGMIAGKNFQDGF